MGSMSTWKPEYPERLSKEILATFPARELANQYEKRVVEIVFDEILNRNYIIPTNLKAKKIYDHDDRIEMRITSDLKEKLIKKSKDNNMSLSNFIRTVLKKKIYE